MKELIKFEAKLTLFCKTLTKVLRWEFVTNDLSTSLLFYKYLKRFYREEEFSLSPVHFHLEISRVVKIHGLWLY